MDCLRNIEKEKNKSKLKDYHVDTFEIDVVSGQKFIYTKPILPEIDVKLKKEIKNYDFRYLTKPGLSGWAQVNYPYGSSINDSYQKLSYDLYYLKNKNFFLDLYIFFRTLKIVFNIKGSKPKT